MLLTALMRFTCCSSEVLQLFMTEIVEAIGVHCISELFFKAIAAICFASLHSIINNKKMVVSMK